MSPPTPDRKTNADHAWNGLMVAAFKKVPRHLYNSTQSRRRLRQLTRRF